MSDYTDRFAGVIEAFSRRANPLAVEPGLESVMRQCLAQGLAELPLPGAGQTLQRWQALADVAGWDLPLVKLFEGHTDAKAILRELQADYADAPGIWGVWAAEPPQARLRVSSDPAGALRLQGRKAWCSGARQIDHALVTAWDEQDRPQLVAVALDQPGVEVSAQGWQALGMGITASVEVNFHNAFGQPVGGTGEYLARPGFWQGGAGIAACWYGAAVTLGHYLRQACERREEPHADAHLGAVDAALLGAGASLRECAAWIDAHPAQDARLPVQATRAQVESAVETVIRHVGRALGAGPYCRDARFARLLADLPVFVRQSHAERDLAALGRLVAERPSLRWSL